jgi:hypothetical protein
VRLRARETIFSETHTNELCGIGKTTPEPAGPCAPLRPGRRVCEKGAGKAAWQRAWLAVERAGGAPNQGASFCWLWRSPPGCAMNLCVWLRARETIFSETHTNEFCGIGKTTPEPAGPCAPLRPGRWVCEKESPKLCGGAVGALHQRVPAPLHGSLRRPLLVPFHTSPLSRGALRSAGVPTIAASTTPAPLQPGQQGLRGIWEDSIGAREYPMCAEGWAMWVLGGSPDLFKATGGTCRLGTP